MRSLGAESVRTCLKVLSECDTTYLSFSEMPSVMRFASSKCLNVSTGAGTHRWQILPMLAFVGIECAMRSAISMVGPFSEYRVPKH